MLTSEANMIITVGPSTKIDSTAYNRSPQSTTHSSPNSETIRR